jgi:hypothetical protein
MATEKQHPILSQKQSDTDSMGAVRFLLRQFALDFQSMLPAQVVSFDRAKNLVRVKPIIMFVDIRDRTIPRSELIDINALSLGAGKYHISFPIAPGDLGWIWASDRDISLFKQSLNEQAPPTDRLHRFEDGMFIPDMFRNYTINGEDSGAMVIQSTNGATRISIRQDNIKITAPVEVRIDVPLTRMTNDVQIDGNLTVNKNATVKLNAQVNGGIAAMGTAPGSTVSSFSGGFKMVSGGFEIEPGQTVSLPTETTVNGKQVDGHVHGGIVIGGDDTEPF